MEKLISTKEAAQYLGVPVSTLYMWRSTGAGPASFKVGRRVMYERRDLSLFLAACRSGGGSQ